jgi:hypothetical protein
LNLVKSESGVGTIPKGWDEGSQELGRRGMHGNAHVVVSLDFEEGEERYQADTIDSLTVS